MSVCLSASLSLCLPTSSSSHLFSIHLFQSNSYHTFSSLFSLLSHQYISSFHSSTLIYFSIYLPVATSERSGEIRRLQQDSDLPVYCRWKHGVSQFLITDCLSVRPSICLSMFLSVYQSIDLCVWLCVCLSDWLHICLSVHLSVGPSVCPWAYVCLSLSVSVSLCMQVCQSVSSFVLFVVRVSFRWVCKHTCFRLYTSPVSTYLLVQDSVCVCVR